MDNDRTVAAQCLLWAAALFVVTATACTGPKRVAFPSERRAPGAEVTPAPHRARPYRHPPLEPPVARACAAMAADNAVDDEARALRPYLGPLASTCIPTETGAWAFRVASAGPANERPPVALVHLGPDRRIDAQTSSDLLDVGGDCNSFGDDEVVVRPVADYDGDGHSEIFVGVHQWGSHHAECISNRIFSLTDGGGIEEMVVTAAGHYLAGVEDVDHDGLEDLLVDIFVADVVDCYGQTSRERGLSLLAHALPDGSFSMTDEVARRYARARCPTPPTTLAGEVECARLWGVSPERIQAEAARREGECLGDFEGTNGPGSGCRQFQCTDQRARAFAAAEVPIDLSK
jgi:hypothetical protein